MRQLTATIEAVKPAAWVKKMARRHGAVTPRERHSGMAKGQIRNLEVDETQDNVGIPGSSLRDAPE